MPLRVFRVCRSIWSRLDGEGAKRVGGRWNSPGRAVVYMAENTALAVLENLVHLSRQDFPIGYVRVGAIIPDTVKILTPVDLGLASREIPPAEVGDQWLHSEASAVLRVPSSVVMNECNYLLNPQHPEFSAIVVEVPVPFVFDPRLFR